MKSVPVAGPAALPIQRQQLPVPVLGCWPPELQQAHLPLLQGVAAEDTDAAVAVAPRTTAVAHAAADHKDLVVVVGHQLKKLLLRVSAPPPLILHSQMAVLRSSDYSKTNCSFQGASGQPLVHIPWGSHLGEVAAQAL